MSNPNNSGQASPRWALMKPFDIYAKDGSGDVYLHRLRLVQTPWFAVYLHDLNLPDTDRDPHDHPWSFVSIVLRGGYTEKVTPVRPGRAALGDVAYKRRWLRFSAHKMGFDQAHMIESVQPRTKTLILAGPRRKSWGFYTEDGYVDWKPYLGEDE